MLSKKPKESTKEKKENTHRFHHPHGSLRSAEFLFFGYAASLTLASHSATLRLTLAVYNCRALFEVRSTEFARQKSAG